MLIYLLLVVLSVLACDDTEQRIPPPSQSPSTIGVVNTASSLELRLVGFKDKMSELGYVEGESVVYIYGGPVGANVEDIEPVVQDLLAREVDLILSLGTPATIVVKRVTAGTGVPVVFCVNDPLAAGIVPDLRHPGGNMTGTRSEPADGRRLEFLLQVAPFVRRVYVPYNPEDPAPSKALAGVSEAASRLGVELVLREARNDGGVAAAVGNIPDDVDAIFLLPDSLLDNHMAEWVGAALARRLPLSGANLDSVEAGALISYGVDLRAGGGIAADLAGQILEGSNPGDLSVQPDPLALGVNLKTATAIGVEIPDEILKQADPIIIRE